MTTDSLRQRIEGEIARCEAIDSGLYIGRIGALRWVLPQLSPEGGGGEDPAKWQAVADAWARGEWWGVGHAGDVAPAPGVDGWQPIATAPKDRPVYVLSRAWGKPTGRWVLGHGLWIEDGWRGPGYYDLADEGNHLSYAELWATLPPVPPANAARMSTPGASAASQHDPKHLPQPPLGDKPPSTPADGEALARRFHETYERLAPSFGYETRQETRAFDPTTPNGRLMIAVCGELAAARDKPPVPAEGVVERVERETAALIEYIADYVMSTEGADYIPTEWERELIEDALCGWESERALSASRATDRGEKEAVGDEVVALLQDACDLLAERRFGNPARSPGHNARLVIEAALRAIQNLAGEDCK